METSSACSLTRTRSPSQTLDRSIPSITTIQSKPQPLSAMHGGMAEETTAMVRPVVKTKTAKTLSAEEASALT